MSEAEEGQARKARSESILSAEGVPFIAHLPEIETVAETTLRRCDEIVDRIFCLMVVSAKAIGGKDNEFVGRYSGDWRCSFTTQERRLIENEVGDRERMMLSWRVEAVPPLLWAINRTDQLPKPYGTADFDLIRRVVEEGPRVLAPRAVVRSTYEILDAADLIYRYHWAVRNAALSGKEDTELNPGVVFQRHYALNWLINYQDQDWDDVSTDT